MVLRHLRSLSLAVKVKAKKWTPKRHSRSFSTNVYHGRKAFGAFHFGTTEYAECFQDLPHPNPDDFHKDAIDYVTNQFNAQSWHDDPICTIVNGQTLSKQTETTVDTFSALGEVNGKMMLASDEQMEQVKDHVRSFQSQWTDLRDSVRQAEQDLLTNHAGALIGNQCIDFGKQDGMTELEETVMACVVERRLNDYLIMEEARGHVKVNRQPVYVHCVSNFSNFLDLSRKALRTLEVGIPIVILGRTNTTTAQQHAYRWTQLLIQHAIHQQGIDPGMITFVSCSVEQTIDLLQSCQEHTGNLYMTGSRDLAKSIKAVYPKTIASTGGPNTMVLATPKQDNPVQKPTLEEQELAETQKKKLLAEGKKVPEDEKDAKQQEPFLTPELKQAIVTSAAIESAGQCTALRHVIVPPKLFTKEDAQAIMKSAVIIESPVAAMKQGQFDGVFLHTTTPTPSSIGDDSYTQDATSQAHWRINDELPQTQQTTAQTTTTTTPVLPEYWRQVVLDFTKLETDPWNYDSIDELATWLNHTQPISLAVNGNMMDAYKTLRRLFDATSLAVYTVGGRNEEPILTSATAPKVLSPALTCQARPQEGEIFGEVPPRAQLATYTQFPVYVPTSNPSYDTHYALEHLQEHGAAPVPDYYSKSCRVLLQAINSVHMKGYVRILVEYLRNIDDDNPKVVPMNSKARTVLWGVQRPPLHTKTILRVDDGKDASWDDCAAVVLLFHVTSARNQLVLSISPDHGNDTLKDFVQQKQQQQQHQLNVVVETDDELQTRVDKDAGKTIHQVFRTTDWPVSQMTAATTTNNSTSPRPKFPMVAQFTSLFFSMGHVKSTAPRDDEFVMRFRDVSDKWIKTLF